MVNRQTTANQRSKRHANENRPFAREKGLSPFETERPPCVSGTARRAVLLDVQHWTDWMEPKTTSTIGSTPHGPGSVPVILAVPLWQTVSRFDWMMEAK
jgi:hypothetical protein